MARALRKGFRAAYDSMGYAVLSSAVWFGVAAVPAAVAVGRMRSGEVAAGVALAAVGVVAGFVWCVGVFYYASAVVYHRHPAPADTFVGIRKLLAPGLALLAVDVAVTVVLAGDAAFFLLMRTGPAFAALGVVCGYALLVWLMMLTYHLPLLVWQLDAESQPRVGVILKKAFLLTFDNPGFTVGLFAAIIAFAVVCSFAIVGAAMLLLGTLAFLLTHALRELFVKYGIVEEEPEVIEDTGWPRR